MDIKIVQMKKNSSNEHKNSSNEHENSSNEIIVQMKKNTGCPTKHDNSKTT